MKPAPETMPDVAKRSRPGSLFGIPATLPGLAVAAAYTLGAPVIAAAAIATAGGVVVGVVSAAIAGAGAGGAAAISAGAGVAAATAGIAAAAVGYVSAGMIAVIGVGAIAAGIALTADPSRLSKYSPRKVLTGVALGSALSAACAFNGTANAPPMPEPPATHKYAPPSTLHMEKHGGVLRRDFGRSEQTLADQGTGRVNPTPTIQHRPGVL